MEQFSNKTFNSDELNQQQDNQSDGVFDFKWKGLLQFHQMEKLFFL